MTWKIYPLCFRACIIIIQINIAFILFFLPLILAFTTFSGINDFDYPALSSPSVGLAGMELVSLLKRVPLPGELVEQFDRILLFDLEYVQAIRKNKWCRRAVRLNL